MISARSAMLRIGAPTPLARPSSMHAAPLVRSRPHRRHQSNMQVSAYMITLKTPDGEQQVECDGDTYILDAAEEQGLDLPYSCRAGTCSTCAAEQQMLTEEQIEEGFVLTCTAYPKEDVTLVTHQEENMY